MIDTWTKSVVQFHHVIHGFFTWRGVGNTIIELKLAQELAILDQDPLFLVLLYLSKVYDNIYQGGLLQTLEFYGSGPNLQGLLAEFWSRQELFTCQNVFHSPQFLDTIDTTQGGLASPALFNASVDSVVLHWISLTV